MILPVAYHRTPTPSFPSILFYLSQALVSILPLIDTAYEVLVARHLPSHPPYAPLSTLLTSLILLCLQAARPVNGPAPAGVTRNPEDAASLGSYLTYTFINPLFSLGWARQLADDEVPDLSPRQKSEIAREAYERSAVRLPPRSYFSRTHLPSALKLLKTDCIKSLRREHVSSSRAWLDRFSCST